MSRLDRFEDILKNYDGREYHAEPVSDDNFLLIMDRRFNPDFHSDICSEGISALIESANHTQKQAVIIHESGNAYFSGWDNEPSDLQRSMWQMYCRKFLIHGSTGGCIESALSKKKVSVLALNSGTMKEILVGMLKKHSGAGNGVAIIEVSGIWPASYNGHGFGIYRKTGSVRNLQGMMQDCVKQIYQGEPAP